MRDRPGNDIEAGDAHWNIVSACTMMNAEYRRYRRSAAYTRWRIRFGLGLIRLGLVVAPLTVADVAGECRHAGAG